MVGRLMELLKTSRNSPEQKGLADIIDDTLIRTKRTWCAHAVSSDRGFKEFIPEWYCAQSKLESNQLYYRFMKIATLLLFEHVSFLNAFQIFPDKNAKRRCVLLSFLKRTYDDLLDTTDISPKDLLDAKPNERLMANSECALLLHLRKKIREIVPQDSFPNYYRILASVHAAQSEEPKKENVKEIIFKKSQASFLIDMSIMVNDLPKAVIDAISVTSEFFACMDDYYDCNEDLSEGKMTYINQCANPEDALQKKYEEMTRYLQKHAPCPEPYLRGLRSFMEIVLFARRGNMRKLSEIV